MVKSDRTNLTQAEGEPLQAPEQIKIMAYVQQNNPNDYL